MPVVAVGVDLRLDPRIDIALVPHQSGDTRARQTHRSGVVRRTDLESSRVAEPLARHVPSALEAHLTQCDHRTCLHVHTHDRSSVLDARWVDDNTRADVASHSQLVQDGALECGRIAPRLLLAAAGTHPSFEVARQRLVLGLDDYTAADDSCARLDDDGQRLATVTCHGGHD